MGTFKISDKELRSQFSYENETIVVTGNFTLDATTGSVKIINGNVSRKDGGEYVCNFSGSMRDDVMRYSVSELRSADATTIWSAIAEIETSIEGSDESTEGGEA